VELRLRVLTRGSRCASIRILRPAVTRAGANRLVMGHRAPEVNLSQ